MLTKKLEKNQELVDFLTIVIFFCEYFPCKYLKYNEDWWSINCF